MKEIFFIEPNIIRFVFSDLA